MQALGVQLGLQDLQAEHTSCAEREVQLACCGGSHPKCSSWTARAIFTGTQSTNLFGDHPFSIKHQDNFSLQNWHPPKLAPSKKGLWTSNLQFLYINYTEITPPQFTFWRVSICILEARIVLGVLYREGKAPKKVGTFGFPQSL